MQGVEMSGTPLQGTTGKTQDTLEGLCLWLAWKQIGREGSLGVPAGAASPATQPQISG